LLYVMNPLSCLELGASFDLHRTLNWGSLLGI